jgi:hypothetical protein
MRIAIAAVVAVAVAALAVAADAAPARKKQQRYAAGKEKAQAVRAPRARSDQFGYDQTPEHYPVGSNQWWRAMEREGRGGFGDTM